MRASDSVGRLLMMGLAGPRLLPEERRALKEIQPAGVIYFRRNVESPRQLLSLSREIARILPRDAPPLIGIDQEGGRVARLGAPFTVFPGNDFLGRAYAKTGKTDLATRQARAMARELKAIGVNLNFTPVADVNTNPRNPIIGPRAFGSDAAVVARLVAATVRGYELERVASCAKHFPGHGDTRRDSHKVLPTVTTPRATLLRRELLPFRSAIRSGVPTVMTAHVIYKRVDPARPATLSPLILKGWLRKRLGFKGVIISDDLEMNAIARHESIPEAAFEAIEAGVDLLLICKSLEELTRTHQYLFRAVERGELPSDRLDDAAQCIERAKRRYVSKRLPEGVSARRWEDHRRVTERIQEVGGDRL